MNWIKIKSELTLNLKRIFENSNNPKYSNFDEGLDLFNQVVLLKTNIHSFDGTSRTILNAIEDAYTQKMGELEPLKILAVELESFLKKLIFLRDNKNYSTDRSKISFNGRVEFIPCFIH